MIDIEALLISIQKESIESENGKKNFAENFTNILLIEEKLSKLPSNIFENPNLKWLDPCAGIGNYPIVLINKLMAGLSTAIPNKKSRFKHIMKNMLYMVEIQEDSCRRLKQNLGSCNLYEGSFLDPEFKEKYNTKFDVIIGNPPYERILDGKRSSKNDNLWSVFIEESISLLNDDGYLLFITPQAWMSPTSKLLHNVFLKYKLIYLNIQECAKYFSVGSKFSYYLIQKTPNDNKTLTEVLCYYPGSTILNKVTINSDVLFNRDLKFVPQIICPKILSILNKTFFDVNIKKFPVTYDSDLHKFTKKTLLSERKDDVFKYKILHTPTQIIWANRPHKNQNKIKVFIPLTTYYEKIIIDDCGNTQGFGYIVCANINEAEKIKAILLTSLYRFIANITRWSNFNVPEVMRSLPYVDVSKYDIDKIDDKLIYKIFNIDKKEQAFISSLLK